MGDAGGYPGFEVGDTGLRLGVEDGVATTHVGKDEVVCAVIIAQVYVLTLARVSTVFERIAVG